MGAADMMIITVNLEINEEQSLIVGDKLRPRHMRHIHHGLGRDLAL